MVLRGLGVVVLGMRVGSSMFPGVRFIGVALVWRWRLLLGCSIATTVVLRGLEMVMVVVVVLGMRVESSMFPGVRFWWALGWRWLLLLGLKHVS